jgi:hypothetical protein
LRRSPAPTTTWPALDFVTTASQQYDQNWRLVWKQYRVTTAGDQLRDADDAERRRLQQQTTRGKAAALDNQRSTRLTSQAGQVIQFRGEAFGTGACPESRQLREPLRAPPRLVDLSPGTRDGTAPVQGFDPIHDAGRVFNQLLAASDQLLEAARAVLAVVDRREQPRTGVLPKDWKLRRENASII